MHQLLAKVRAALDPTVVMVTHDLDEAGLADRVAVLVDGRIEQVDTIQRLYTAPSTLAVARLVGGFNEVPGTVKSDVHHSPLGAVAVPPSTRVSGRGVLLVRKERLALVAPDSGTVTGRIVQSRQSGARQDVVVELDGQPNGARMRVEVQLPLGTVRGSGDRTGVLLPSADDVWAVCDNDGVSSGTQGDPVRDCAGGSAGNWTT